MSGELVIDVRGLTKNFGEKRVVDHFDIRVPRGAIYGFLGPNGSGKTTTIRMLCGLLTPDEGEGTCLGFDVRKQADKIKEEVGYMTQKFSYYEDLSIRENLDFVARMYRLDRRKQRVDEALRDLGLADRQKQLAGSLSGGWKQRLALAAGLLHNPQMLSCCCSMSPRPASTRKRGAISGTKSAGSAPRASPCWFRRTTWTRLCSAISSPTSPMARS
jgi:ABC-2 type transport system ATP-binding protein